MTAPSIPNAELLARLDIADATADMVESAVRFRLTSLVGSGPPFAVLSIGIDCERIDFGDSVIGNVFTNIVIGLCEFLRGLLDTVLALVASVVTQILEFVRALLDRVVLGIDQIIDVVTAAISSAISSILDTLGGVLNTILTKIGEVIDTIRQTAGDVLTAIRSGIRSAIDAVGVAVTFIIDKVRDGFGALLTAATNVIATIRTVIGDVIRAIIDTAVQTFNDVGAALATLIDVVVGTAEAGLGAVRETIESIPAALRELATEAAETLAGVVGAPLSTIGELFITQVEAFFERLLDELDTSPDKIIRDFLGAIGIPSSVIERIAQSAGAAMPQTFVFTTFALTVMVPLLVLPAVSAAMSPALEQMRQEVNQIVRPTLLSPGDALESFFRGTLSETELKNELSQAGFTDDRIALLLTNSRRLLDLGEVFRWWLRDIITEDQLDDIIATHHINAEDAARIKQTVFFIPPVQDLITMAVREVFTPTVRETFQLDEDFPDDFKAFAKNQGISEEWARNYWAAHWVLPSLNQGFEMLHRRVITLDELGVLMRAQDVMPFWREKLTEIAFSPLTRVDVRRMQGLGLIADDELISRYMDLGFNEANADMMAQFTLAFNADDPPEVAELEGLTRSNILGMFDDGVLTEREAKDIMMVGLGLSENVAELFLTHRKLVRERADRSALIQSIVELAGGGIIQLPEAQDSLARAGLTAVEIAMAVRRILSKRESRDRLPTVPQLAKMLAADIITAEVWREAMQGQGYPDVWIDRLGELQATGAVE